MLEKNDGMWEAVESILTDLVNSAGSQRAEALFHAAVPQWFPADLYAVLSPEDAVEYLNWVTKFSFVSVLSSGSANFMMQPMERAILNEIFIDRAPDLYRLAHGRALDYWLNNPHGDPFIQAQNVLYHRILVDQATARLELIDLYEHYVEGRQSGAGEQWGETSEVDGQPRQTTSLIDLFKPYEADRQLGALDQLLEAVDEACGYLRQLNQPSQSLEELLTYMMARSLQLRGSYEESIRVLDGLELTAEPGLQPYVTRAYGFANAGLRDYADAIDLFQKAARQFEQNKDIIGQERSLVESADTLIALGDAYIDLAEDTISLDERRWRLESRGGFLRGLYYLLLSLPLAVYMTLAIGIRAWMPKLWTVWRDVDWVKADLYSLATSHYREASRLLDKVDRPDKDLIAEEKLADLYLNVGDAVEARTLYERLLTSTQLSRYRRSRIQVGMGQTQWLLGDEESAGQALAAALPDLRSYADEDLEAEAETVLGSIAAHSDEPEGSLKHFQRALDIYLAEYGPDLVAATNVAEQLDVVAEHPSLSSASRAAARKEAARVEERHYPVQQRHRITRFFQQMFLFAVIVLAGLGLQNMLSIDRTTVAPEIIFHAFPLLDTSKEEPVAILDTSLAVSSKSPIGSIAGEEANLLVGQGVTSLLISDPELQFVLVGLLFSFLGYVITVTVIGILLLRRIDPHEVQKTRESTTVRLAAEGLSVGEDAAEQTISFADVSRYVVSNTNLLRQPISESYLLLEKPAGDQLIIKGATTHYERVQRHIEERLPAEVEHVDLSHSLLISLAGVLLLFTVLLYLVMALFSRLGDHTLHAPIAGSSYSGVAFYPYLLLGFLLPLLWWFVWKPLQRGHRLDTFDWTPFLLILSGLLVALGITIVTGLGFGYRLSTPDLYPALIAVSLVLAGVVALTVRAVRRRRASGARESERHHAAEDAVTEPQDESGAGSASSLVKRVETSSQHVPTSFRVVLFAVLYLLLILVAVLMFLYLSREINAYHRSVQGNDFLNNSNELKLDGDEAWEEYLVAAHRGYSEVIESNMDGSERWAVLDHEFDKEILADTYTKRAHISLILAIEDLSSTPGAVESGTSDLGQLEDAINDYKKVVELAPQAPHGYLWLGFAHHTAGNKEEALDYYACALMLSGLPREQLSSWMSSKSCPQPGPGGATLEPEYIVKALTGRGWIYFAEEKYPEALANFLFAVELADRLDPEPEQPDFAQSVSEQAKCEAALGLGYTNYGLKRFYDALQVWQQAEEHCPQNPALLTSLGTVKWRLGTLGEDHSVKGKDRCSIKTLDEADKLRATGLLEEAINYLTQSAEIDEQVPEDRAFTYRTRGQVQFLLRNCPGYEEDKLEILGEAVRSYIKATEHDSLNSNYWYYLSRMRYAYWTEIEATGPAAREPVVQALLDINEMMRLDGRSCEEADYEPCSIWYPAIYRNAVTRTLGDGDNLFEEGDYETATGYYALLTGHEPELAESYHAHFGLAFTELAQGNTDVAREWFQSGISLAAAEGDRKAIGQTWQDLKDLSEMDSTLDLDPIQAIFEELDFDYDAGAALDRATQALDGGNSDEALEAYEQGVTIAVDIGDLDLIKSTLLQLLEEPSVSEEILDVFRGHLPGMETAAGGDKAVREAFDLGFIAWALGEGEMAGQWYQEGIRRTAVNPDSYYQELLPFRDDLAALWGLGVEVDADNLIAAMDSYRTEQLKEYSEMADNKWYWRFHGWFKYHVASRAFQADAPEIARSVLDSGKKDTEEALRVDESNRDIYEYLHQGAWSWYFIDRANEALETGDYDTALADYEAAMEAYPGLVTVNWAHVDMVIGAFNAGLAAFNLGDREQTLQWYEMGVERAKMFETVDQLQEARDTLSAEEPAGDTAAELQKEILELLDSE